MIADSRRGWRRYSRASCCWRRRAQANAQDARAFVATLGEQAIQVLGPNASPAQRLARFRELFHDDFDIPGIGQFVLGRYWRTATPQQQQDFLGLFQEYLVRAYSARLSEYAGEPFRVTGSRPEGDDRSSSPARSSARTAIGSRSTGI